jgi:Ca2+ transporting ATPase
MGGANNVCTDKTGTLTKNLMTVTRFWTEGKVLDTFDKNLKLTRLNGEMLGKGICMNSNANPKIGQN